MSVTGSWFDSFCFNPKLFIFSYMKEFGFTIPGRPIVVDDIRVRGCGKSGIQSVYEPKLEDRKAKPVMVNILMSRTNKTFLKLNLTG